MVGPRDPRREVHPRQRAIGRKLNWAIVNGVQKAIGTPWYVKEARERIEPAGYRRTRASFGYGDSAPAGAALRFGPGDDRDEVLMILAPL